MENSDDAGVFRLDSETALIQTIDFFTPVVDSPCDFGRIAAANSLSDVYAMGGKPLTAMNMVCFPSCDLPVDVLRETLEGGLEKIDEAGAVLVGGHSVDDLEFKYGLSVTGVVHPDKVITNCNASTGDMLILTKPLGLGIIATAIKGKIADKDTQKKFIETASALNRPASEIMVASGASACTDITGFGLCGHLLEMAKGSKKEIHIYADELFFLPKAEEYAEMGLIPAGAYENRRFCGKRVHVKSYIKNAVADICFDPQTSGGLLISINKKNAVDCLLKLINKGVEAAVIGEVAGEEMAGRIIIK